MRVAWPSSGRCQGSVTIRSSVGSRDEGRGYRSGARGLVTAAALAHLGHRVVAMDLDEAKIELLRSGKVPFHEPELDDLVAAQTGTGRLLFELQPVQAVRDAEVLFICVGRPTTAAGDASS